MGQASRRRKGKGGSRSSTPIPSSENENEKSVDAVDADVDTSNGKIEKKEASMNDDDDNIDLKINSNEPKGGNENRIKDVDSLLVFTSEKRRGIYECDYCHSDISQQPRIRCAVCSDFDLCLDCFATTDHAAMMARIKAATQTQAELTKDGIGSTSIVAVAISSAAAHHEDHHCYRVCDSTRYPVFPTGRIVTPSLAALVKKGTTEEKQTEKADTSSNDKMSIQGGQDEADTPSLPTSNKNFASFQISLSDDPKTMWTAEEDLRLIDAISTHGLGNWVDIAEAIGGHGSVGKTPKRCMERYLDDFVGRYGHVLPQWTIVDDTVEESAGVSTSTNSNQNSNSNSNSNSGSGSVNNTSNDTGSNKDSSTSDSTTSSTVVVDTKDGQDQIKSETGKEKPQSDQQTQKKEGDEPATAGTDTSTTTALSLKAAAAANNLTFKNTFEEEEGVRTSKRRTSTISILGSAGASMTSSGRSSSSSRKKLRVLPTESFPGYDMVWPRPYLPEISGAVVGKEVARDQSCKAELAFVKATLAASSKKEADKIRQTWVDTKLGRVGSPTVLPPRPHDAAHLLGSELAGFMPRRGDFDVEWENDAESALADMEFIQGDKPEDKELKLKVLQIYCEKLDEREKRKKFVLNRHLFDYRKYVQNDLQLPLDERDLVHRMRLFERFHTPDEHKKFIVDILKAKRLRKEIAKLQMYRRIGIKSLAEAEMYELDKDRRQFHKKLEGDAKAKAAAIAIANSKGTTKGVGTPSTALILGTSRTPSHVKGTDSLWKQYRTNDRKNRRNSNSRSVNSIDSLAGKTSSEITAAPNSNGGEKEGDKGEEKETVNASVVEGEAIPADHETKTEAKEDEPMGAEEKADADVTNEQDDDASEIDVKREAEFNLSEAPCRNLLSRKELALCERQQIYPIQYLEIKKVLIHESLLNGLLDKDSSRRTIVKIDVERRGNVVEFLVRAGWINRKLADVAMRVVTPQPL
jgi:hypothetical protein